MASCGKGILQRVGSGFLMHLGKQGEPLMNSAASLVEQRLACSHASYRLYYIFLVVVDFRCHIYATVSRVDPLSANFLNVRNYPTYR